MGNVPLDALTSETVTEEATAHRRFGFVPILWGGFCPLSP